MPAGRHICREGFTAEAFYILLSGTAVVQTSRGTQATLGRGEFFGELGLIDGWPRTADVISVTDVWTARLPRDTLARLMDQEPTIARGIMEALALRIRRLEATAEQGTDPAASE